MQCSCGIRNVPQSRIMPGIRQKTRDKRLLPENGHSHDCVYGRKTYDRDEIIGDHVYSERVEQEQKIENRKKGHMRQQLSCQHPAFILRRTAEDAERIAQYIQEYDHVDNDCSVAHDIHCQKDPPS